jgi:DNA repair photolyase
MPIIYEPRGKVREYSDLAVNLFAGCSHACRYCYCPAVLRKTIDACVLDPQPRKNILRGLDRDASPSCDREGVTGEMLTRGGIKVIRVG